MSYASLSLPTLRVLYKDSVLYDASGNITKVLQTSIFGPTNQPEQTTYSLFEFTRDTKGSQLSDFNKTLFNGISKYANVESSGLNGFDDFFYYQFTLFRSLSSKVYEQYTSSYLTFNPDPEYDKFEPAIMAMSPIIMKNLILVIINNCNSNKELKAPSLASW